MSSPEENDTFGGLSKKDIMLATIIGVFLLVGGSTAGFLITQGFDDELSRQMVTDYHGIIVLAAGGGLVALGIVISNQIKPTS